MEVERLGGDSDQQYFTSYNHANSALMKLEESVRQESLGNREAATADWDAAIVNIHDAVASLDAMLATEKKILDVVDKYGAEPGFEQALRSLDSKTVIPKLINANVVPNNPALLEEHLARVRKEGARGLITGRMAGIEKLRAMAVEWEKVVRDSRAIAAQGEIVEKIDGPGFAPTKASQQMLKALADNLAADCTAYAYISKMARGTLGW